MLTSRALHLGVVLACIILPDTVRGDQPLPPKLLRVQQAGDTTYFHVRFDAPADMRVPAIQPGPYGEWERRRLALTPQLVPQDGKAWAVYHRLPLTHFRPVVGFGQKDAEAAKELEFAGKLNEKGKARFLLLYPTSQKEKPPAGIQDRELAELLRPVRWAEAPIELDFDAAVVVRAGDGGEDQASAKPQAAIEALWAQAQASRLAVLEALAPEFGFYSFACAATGRKYGVPDPVLEGDRKKGEEHIHRRMLDLTTGTMAITQSLALKRLRGPGVRAPLARTVDIAKVPGIEIAEHPWGKMMAGKKPAPEPLAKLVPHDNYYVHFKSFAKFSEFQDFIQQWGTPAARAYEVQSREYGLKERYERQLCLKSTWLGRTLGPLLVRSIAITGNDPYIREGSDVTVLFHVTSRQAFLAGVDQFLQEARKEFGGRLKEGKEAYQGVAIESFVTPQREVSLHRAAFDDVVVYSNSPAGLRRVLDTAKGWHKSLSESLDFQYMRTVFRADDQDEDGFAFLSDAFIRQLVGPASKIKEMRRLEALTSLGMLTNGALFTAWETGKLPADHKSLMEAASLRPEYLYVPEGKAVRWDVERQVAISDAYNTILFATPLVELPIDKITPFEEQTYREFRNEYQQLWRQFFDPVGIRFGLGKKQAKVEVYVLPMIENAEYTRLRSWTGNGMFQFDPTKLSPRSLLQFTMNLQPGWLGGGLGGWAMIRLDDNQTLARLGEWWIRDDLLPKDRTRHGQEVARLIFQLPITAGIGITNKAEFAKQQKELTEMMTSEKGWLAMGPAKLKESRYKDTVITRVKWGPESRLVKQLNDAFTKGKLTTVVLYHAVIEDGWYAGFDKGALKDLIDRAAERKQNKPADAQTVPINASWHMAPRAADRAGAALRQYLEWETHKRALPNDALWYVLYRGNLLQENTPEPARRAAATQFLGFIPTSPDDAPYRYDAAKDEMVNARHGSLRQPRLHSGIADDSPLVELLTQFPTLRIDLRFREDGFHSVVTVERKGK